MSRRPALLLALALGLTAPGRADPAHAAATPPQPANAAAAASTHAIGEPESGATASSLSSSPVPAHPPARSEADPAGEIASLLRLGASKTEQKDYASAEMAYMSVLKGRASRDHDREAVLGLARLHRRKGDFTRAAAAYEKLLKEFPEGTEQPEVYLELGRTLRALGAHKLAINRFYSVINATLKVPGEAADRYRQLARTAQYEIAETYFVAGDFQQANKYFSRLRLLDLAPEDRARAHFKSAYALVLAGDFERAVTALRSFLEEQPDDENVPEARHLLASALRRIGRPKEALVATMELLRAEHARDGKDPKRWAYWQRRTGNQLANEFYEQGDFQSALVVYQALAELGNASAWRLPALYQAGLCHERLGQNNRARDCYQSVVGKTSAPAADDDVSGPDLGDVAQMAAWRLKHLDWQTENERQFTTFFTAAPSPESKPVPAPEPDAHDVHGSAAKPSPALR